MGGDFASSPARSPSELAPLPGSPGPGSPAGSPAREALRRALNGDDETPNLALAPLRWNIEKERRARGAALKSAEEAFDAEAARRVKRQLQVAHVLVHVREALLPMHAKS